VARHNKCDGARRIAAGVAALSALVALMGEGMGGAFDNMKKNSMSYVAWLSRNNKGRR
jgi:hypothetical protein